MRLKLANILMWTPDDVSETEETSIVNVIRTQIF